jgi:hypothetical protein
VNRLAEIDDALDAFGLDPARVEAARRSARAAVAGLEDAEAALDALETPGGTPGPVAASLLPSAPPPQDDAVADPAPTPPPEAPTQAADPAPSAPPPREEAPSESMPARSSEAPLDGAPALEIDFDGVDLAPPRAPVYESQPPAAAPEASEEDAPQPGDLAGLSIDELFDAVAVSDPPTEPADLADAFFDEELQLSDPELDVEELDPASVPPLRSAPPPPPPSSTPPPLPRSRPPASAPPERSLTSSLPPPPSPEDGEDKPPSLLERLLGRKG